ncbi:Imm6 family immunity protein [Streptococcus sp. ST14]|uniref:Imm6 family immunity protein n=1 Tax=Streptococcus sp. ST14 TaxID=3378284 RepID=UPI0038D4C95B
MLTSYFMLIFAEAIANHMETQYISHIRSDLDACWSFLENRDKRGEELYCLLDDGTDFSGIFIYMQLDENEANGLLWDNISYAIGETAKEAFEFGNKKELPSPLENIEPELLDVFIDNLKEISMDLYHHVEAVKRFINRNPYPSRESALKELDRLGLFR